MCVFEDVHWSDPTTLEADIVDVEPVDPGLVNPPSPPALVDPPVPDSIVTPALSDRDPTPVGPGVPAGPALPGGPHPRIAAQPVATTLFRFSAQVGDRYADVYPPRMSSPVSHCRCSPARGRREYIHVGFATASLPSRPLARLHRHWSQKPEK
jgi:hypothetical protein